MNYKLHYERLTQRAKDRKLDCYTESHHIIPRCMNGSNEKYNLVKLTAREHFVAHILLVKIYPEHKGLINAVNMMTVSSKLHERVNNRMYSWLKERFSKCQSILQTGKSNSNFGKVWVFNIEENKPEQILKEELNKYLKLNYNEGKKLQKCICGNIIKEKTRNLYCKKTCKDLKVKKTNTLKEKRIQIMNESNIDFNSNGWVGKLSNLFEIGDNKAGRWVKNNLPEFYEEKCFKRGSASRIE